MKKPYAWMLCILMPLLLTFCAQHITDDGGDDDGTKPDTSLVLVQKVGTDKAFEIMTWNIENFPTPNSNEVNIPRTLLDVQTIIRNLDVDMIAVEEIVDVNKFNELVDGLEGWSGVLNPYPAAYSGYQHTGLIYKNTVVSVQNSRYILDNHSYQFASRPPFSAFVKVHDAENTVVFDFNVIVLHLKAYSDEESEQRRREACAYLENYISEEISAGADSDFVVLGDWNDEITDVRADNVFNVFLDKASEYRFLTGELTNQYSYASFNSLIDHIMISAGSEDEYGQGKTQVLYLDREFNRYFDEVSDHRPVMARFNGITLQ